ncbi:pre-mRNA-splicing factor CWC22 homolog [Colias croceus]|uniref:pre-mRNA-splicing factor CWC22 homolog n=1 Tax=Colias crocea TaxID=72248 RepID=UPI001E27AF47|nr:pre-mRNA-splicing factor CWC22 homolog [Colias croceus]
MECEENGKKCCSPARVASGVKRKRRADDAGNLRLPVPDTVPGPPAARPMHNNLFQFPGVESTEACFKPSSSNPFMNNMDEISYWVFTKRAPCLYDYDRLIKKQNEEAQNSRQIRSYTFPTENEVPSPKRKKKNNKLLDEESDLSGKRQNIYFEMPQPPISKAVVNNCKSVSPGSDTDFKIKITTKPKEKKPKLQKNTKTNVNKRNKMVTSTPKVEHQNLRRSSRLNKQNINNNGQFDNSLEILNETVVNGLQKELSLIENKEDVLNRHEDDTESKTKNQFLKKVAKNDRTHNGDYEDYSDVSGFTANYIRSTKLQSKTPRKVRRKTGRNLMQASRQNVDPESSKIIMCVNKAVNVGAPNSGILNHSTDSSQNVINLVTVATEDKSNKVNQSTSLLKFVDSHCDKTANVKKNSGKFINDSFQSGSSAASRYPKRMNSQNRNYTKQEKQNDRKENSHEKFVYRTRSRKRLIDDSCEQGNSNEDSSNAVINVASPEQSKMKSVQCIEQNGQLTELISETRQVKKNDLISDVPKCLGRVKTSLDRTKQSSKKDSFRDKSGFATCFSDSDSDGEPLKPRKFFG